MHYKLYTKNPSTHYLYIDISVDNIDAAELQLQLPSWRPGRYELGNFAKNVKKFEAFNEKGDALQWKKANKDLWLVNTNGAKSIKVTYSYFASEINAGSSYVDAEQVYVNPVNCCMYVPEKRNEEHLVELILPAEYTVATSLRKKEKHLLSAADFEELADSPFMASAAVQTLELNVRDIHFLLHFNGECKPNKEKLLQDFSCFCEEIVNYFGECPVKEYHFLFQVLTYKFYHGVEHKSSTVIALGPGHNLMYGETYGDLIGVSCHELFHTWNIKTIRPVEMLPYDFTRENYARTGFVYEGITTYYGDKLLLTSGVFKERDYFKTLEERLDKHFHNYGRFNLSVADSSLDNWLDGYVPGAPYRKVSIYDEGNLVAFMLDVLILKQTGNKKSLRDVMRLLYTDFYKKNKGYTENDINTLVHFVAGTSFDDFFTRYVYGVEEYENQLQECFNYLGLEMEKQASEKFYEQCLGMKAIDQGTNKKVSMIAPYSPAWEAQLSINDEIIAVNGYQLRNDFNNWLHYYSDSEELELSVLSNGKIKQLKLKPATSKSYFPLYKIIHLRTVSEQQKLNFAGWLKKSEVNV